jgi:ATP synthase, F0 subunit b
MSLITPDSGLLIWMTLIFAVVFFLLAKFGFPIITKMVKKRSDYIGKSLEDARLAEERLKGLEAEQKKMIEDTRREQARILNEAADARDKIIADATEDAKAKVAKMVEKASQDIEAQKESAMREVRREVATLSVSVAEKLLRANLDSQSSQDALIDRLINEAKAKSDTEIAN